MKRHWKSIALCSTLLIIAIGIGSMYFRFPWQRVHIEDAIPVHSALILQVSDSEKLQDCIKKSGLQTGLQHWRVVDKMLEDMLLLKAFYGAKNPVSKIPFWAALLNTSQDEFDYLYVFDAEWHKINLESQLSQIDGSHIKQHVYQGNTIFTVFTKDNRKFHFMVYDNLILASRSAVLVEDAGNQIKDKDNSLASKSEWKNTYTAMSKYGESQGIQLFLNTQECPSLLSGLLVEAQKPIFQKLCNNLTWIGLRPSFGNDGIAMQGVISPLANSTLLNGLKGEQQQISNEILSILPENTAAMSYLKVNNFQTMFNKVAFNGSRLFSEYFSGSLGDDMALLMTEPYGKDTNADVFSIFKIKDSTLLVKRLRELHSNETALPSTDYMAYRINELDSKNIGSDVWGDDLAGLEKPFYSFVNGYLVFSNTQSGIKTFIDNYNVSHTLSNDVGYQQFAQKNAKSQGGLYQYINFNFLKNTLKTFFIDEYFNGINEQTNACFSDMPRLGLRLKSDGDRYYFDGLLERAQAQKTVITKASGTVSLWKFALNNEVATQPFVVRNPTSKENEIMIQDVDNQLYLINRQGEIRWTRKLSKRLISDVTQIDYFENNNLYYVFNTESEIFIIDKDGKDIKNFPLRLQSPATNGMLIIDFEGTKKYEFFIACQNSNFYGFEKSGKPLSGWNPVSGIGLVRHPFLHFQNGGKDFILAITDRGMLHILRRNGGDRFSSQDFRSKFLSPPSFQADRYSQRIVACDAKGRVHNINMEGVEFPLLLSSGAGTRFAFADVIGDLRKDYIAVANNKLVCHAYEGNEFLKQYAYVFPDVQDDVFALQHANKSKALIGTLSKESSLIYLLEGAKLYPTFPIPGTTRFVLTDFYDNGSSILIVGNDNDVCGYKVE